jgi:GNAT superfamily N-acetyltransferase
MPLTTIRPADPGEIDTIARLLAAAFDEPVTHWLVPDPTRHPVAITGLFARAATDALKHGTIDILTDDTDHPLAAAVWFDLTLDHPATGTLGDDSPDDDTPGGTPEADSGAEPVTGGGWAEAFTDAADAARWLALDQLMTRHHLPGPHHYLFAIGVHPGVQGRGLGSRLLTHRHPVLGGHPAYLEATSQSSRRLYQRHGYTDLGPLHVPGGPPLWRMLRQATCPAAAGRSGHTMPDPAAH